MKRVSEEAFSSLRHIGVKLKYFGAEPSFRSEPGRASIVTERNLAVPPGNSLPPRPFRKPMQLIGESLDCIDTERIKKKENEKTAQSGGGA